MLLVSMRLSRRKILLACVVGCALVIGLGSLFRVREVSVNLDGDGAVIKNYTVNTGDQRLAFITQFGWEVEEEPVEIEEVLIPREFDTLYEDYNALQKSQGLDLTRYRGQKVRRFCYRILNYPDCTDEVRLNMLVAENKIIGGDVCSTALDGFMHGFRYENEPVAVLQPVL